LINGGIKLAEFRIIERVGISNKSISDAVKNAITSVKTDGDIHFFKIIEQRGKVINNNDIEFQVIIKIGLI
jgi:flavin-binding protein dodecin